MAPDHIVEPLDVVEHICPGLVPGAIDFTRGPLGLQRREEALHRRVVPNIAGSAHAANDAVGHQTLELLAGVLAALIRVMQQLIRLATSPEVGSGRIGYAITAAAPSEISNGAKWNADPSFNVADSILADPEFASVLKVVLRDGHVLIPSTARGNERTGTQQRSFAMALVWRGAARHDNHGTGCWFPAWLTSTALHKERGEVARYPAATLKSLQAGTICHRPPPRSEFLAKILRLHCQRERQSKPSR
jgi:hypothetical protein